MYEKATMMMRWEAQHCNNLLRNKRDKVEAIKMKWRAWDNWCSSTLILSALRALLDQCYGTRWTHVHSHHQRPYETLPFLSPSPLFSFFSFHFVWVIAELERSVHLTGFKFYCRSHFTWTGFFRYQGSS